MSILILNQGRHQFLIASRLLITQIVTLVYHYQYALAMLKIIKLGIVIAHQSFILQICMETYKIIKLVILKTGTMATQVLLPVLFQFLWTKQYRLITFRLEIFYNCECRECLSESHSICKDSTIIVSQHLDERDNSLLLVIEQCFPYHTVLQC